ncbi:mitochondrial inner membrane protease subunit 1-like [Crassostrea angulata]|uniref:mitochondrial inner membrane protease subunit 1-like n=1 Tax=Magallana angulata TaxID=2784310 RepID=UPI0022B1C3C2|nr:mitochondrial inner membrane protease subunit 1-like [Crassostrea angulata]
MWRIPQRMKRILFSAYCGSCGILLFANKVAWTIDLIGNSMYPAIHSNDKALIEYLTVSNYRVQKGDVVILKNPYKPTHLVCKRIIGMEHDYITNEDGKIIKVPKGHVWIEGDNKADSEDSRDYGPVPYGLLESRVFFRWWPTRRMGPIKLPGEEDILETRVKSGLYLSRSKESEEQ